MKPRRLLPTGNLLALLLGGVIAPALLSITVGIIALALQKQGLDIVIGVLVLSFAALSLIGGGMAIAFLRRSAKLSEMQADFVANVSHELRTPLAGIRLLVETLARGRAESPDAREEVLSHLAAEEQRLEQLVDRILTWRHTAADMSAPRTSEDVSALLREAITPLQLGATRIELECSEDLRPMQVDREAVIGAVRNLVDNAVKFAGDRGPVTVSARSTGREVVIAVHDLGPGIAPRDRKKILEPFYRAVAQRHHRGTGLGLAIVQRVAEAHRGELVIESVLGAGATFSLVLPHSEATPPTVSIRAARRALRREVADKQRRS